MRALVILLLVPMVGGQAILTDPAGDQEAGYYPEHWNDEPATWQGTEPQGWYRYVDLLGIGIAQETPADLLFTTQFAGGKANGEPQVHPYGAAQLNFDWHGESWRFEQRQSTFDDSGFAFIGAIETADVGTGTVERYRERFSIVSELVDGVWRSWVSKDIFRDAQQLPMRSGDVISAMAATGLHRNNYYVSPCATNDTPNCWKARDLVTGSGEFTISLDAPGVGHLFAESPAPFRGSNGVATTYLYNITVRNLGAIADRLTVQVGAVSNDWVVRAPATVALAAGGRVSVPVAVTVPFVHRHGGEETFDVRFASTLAPGTEAVQTLGVVWHETPQPGGHHPVVYLHGSGYGLWFNTLEADPQDDGDQVGRANSVSSFGGLEGTDYKLGFGAALLPGLLMGLDFIPDQTVEGTTTFTSPGAVAGEARFELFRITREGDRLSLAEKQQAFEFVEGDNELHWSVAVAEGVDRVEYETLAQLYLRLDLAYHVGRDAVDFVPGGGNEQIVLDTSSTQFDLPLQDFHDVIDADLLSSLSRLSLQADGDSSKAVNPGRTAAFAFALTNNGGSRVTVDWGLEGTHADWARVVPRASTVGAGETVTVLVAVTPPANAAENDVVDVLLIGAARDDSGMGIFGRAIATVTTTGEVADEAALAEAIGAHAEADRAKQSPSAGLGILMLGLASLVARRR